MQRQTRAGRRNAGPKALTRRDSGAALIAALGLLAILTIIGYVFYEYMETEQSLATLETARLRAFSAAVGGVAAVKQGLQTSPDAVLSGKYPLLKHEYMDELGSYAATAAQEPNAPGSVKVTVTGSSTFGGVQSTRQIVAVMAARPELGGRLGIVSWDETPNR